MSMGETLNMFMQLCKDVNNDNKELPENIDTEMLEKIVCQMRVMNEVLKESSSMLLELDRRAVNKE